MLRTVSALVFRDPIVPQRKCVVAKPHGLEDRLPDVAEPSPYFCVHQNRVRIPPRRAGVDKDAPENHRNGELATTAHINSKTVISANRPKFFFFSGTNGSKKNPSVEAIVVSGMAITLSNRVPNGHRVVRISAKRGRYKEVVRIFECISLGGGFSHIPVVGSLTTNIKRDDIAVPYCMS